MINKKVFTAVSSLTLVSAISVFGLAVTPTMALSQSHSTTTKIASALGKGMGKFVNGEKSTQGSFQIVSMNGKKYLEFDQEFSTGNGPDVLVLLHRSSNPKSYSDQDYINLGFLKKATGYQRYELPDTLDVSQFKSVSIWCREFNVTFGYAPFS